MPRQARERLILDVAGQVFARNGYHAASMDEIAERAQVSKPMLYAYFGSKEGLYVAYIDRTGNELVRRLLEAAPRLRNPPDRVRAPIEEFLAFVEQHRDGWRVLFAEAGSSKPLAEEVAGLRRQITDAVRRMIGATGGACLGARELDGLAHAIVGAGESLANWWLEHPEIPREQVAAIYVGMVEAATRRGEVSSARNA